MQSKSAEFASELASEQQHFDLARKHRERIRAELLSQKPKRLIQRVSCPDDVELRPEQRQQLVASANAAGPRRGEVNEQCQSLRLHEHSVEAPTAVVVQFERSQRAQPDHETTDRVRVQLARSEVDQASVIACGAANVDRGASGDNGAALEPDCHQLARMRSGRSAHRRSAPATQPLAHGRRHLERGPPRRAER